MRGTKMLMTVLIAGALSHRADGPQERRKVRRGDAFIRDAAWGGALETRWITSR